MTNDRQVYILPLVNYNVNWSIIGHLYCMTSYVILEWGVNKKPNNNLYILALITTNTTLTF